MDEVRSTEMAVISSYPTSVSGIIVDYRSYSLLSRTIFSQNFKILNAKPGGVGGCGLKPSFSE